MVECPPYTHTPMFIARIYFFSIIYRKQIDKFFPPTNFALNESNFWLQLQNIYIFIYFLLNGRPPRLMAQPLRK